MLFNDRACTSQDPFLACNDPDPMQESPYTPGGDVERVGAAGHAPQQAVRGGQRHLVKLHARVLEPALWIP